MSIEKIYSNHEMTRVELGKYIPDVDEENAALVKKVKHYKQHGDICGIVVGVSAAAIAVILLSMLAVDPSTRQILALSCLAPVATGMGGCLAMDICEDIYAQRVKDGEIEIRKATIEKADRSVDLQNEANRLWVKREQIRALKDNNNADFDEKLKIIDEKFGISPNVNSEEDYLAYWANPNNKV